MIPQAQKKPPFNYNGQDYLNTGVPYLNRVNCLPSRICKLRGYGWDEHLLAADISVQRTAVGIDLANSRYVLCIGNHKFNKYSQVRHSNMEPLNQTTRGGGG